MKKRFGFMLMLAIWAAVTSAQDGTVSPQKSNSRLLKVNAIVTDSMGQVVADLEKEHFEIYDNNRKQEISFFSKKDAQVSMAILVDISASAREYIPGMVAALNGFMGRLRNDDEVRLIKFNDEVFLVQDYTSPGNISLNERVFDPGGGTALYDALYLALRDASRMRHARRALLVISDGKDRDSYYTLKQIRKLLEKNDIQVFAVNLAEKGQLKEFTDATGGRILVPGERSKSEYSRALDQILEMLRLQYSIGFYAADAEDRENTHKVEIRVEPPRETGRVSLSYKKNHSFQLP